MVDLTVPLVSFSMSWPQAIKAGFNGCAGGTQLENLRLNSLS